MSAFPSPQSGDTLVVGRYVIHRKLGSGSMGTVYLARDSLYPTEGEGRGRMVALKVIRTERLIADAVARMQEEFRAIASLRHPQIARAYDFGYVDQGGIPFYTREYIEGLPLPPGPPRDESPQVFLRPLLDLLHALNYLHVHGIVHLDIHAGNLIVADDEKRGSLLIDFGLIRSVEESRYVVSSGSWPAVPPEMLDGGECTPRSDVYLAGRLLLYRLTARSEGDARLPREIPGWGPRLTLELERIISKATQPAPSQRFGSAAEFRDALSEALGDTDRRAQPIEPHEVTIGREKEVVAIEQALNDARRGEPVLVWFVGQRGVGKTRLLTEARLRAQLCGVEVVEFRFFPDPGPGPTLLRALRVGCKGSHQWLKPLAAQHGGTPDERAQRAAEAYFCEEASSGMCDSPLVLLLDDLDRAEGESRCLVDALVAECLRRQKRSVKGRGLAIIVTSTRTPPRGIPRRSCHLLRPLRGAAAKELFRAFLRPLDPPEPFIREAVDQTAGSPLLLRQMAIAIKTEWGQSGAVPPTAKVPKLPPCSAGTGTDLPADFSPLEREILDALAVLNRAASVEETAVAIDRDTRLVARSLSQLARVNAVSVRGKGAARRYQSRPGTSAQDVTRQIPRSNARRTHKRVVAWLKRKKRLTVRDQENLARHLLASGKRREGWPAALEAAKRLRKSGSFDRAVSLLEEARRGERSTKKRLLIAEEVSTVLGETGDHRKGIAVLEPFHTEEAGKISAREAVRVRRRRGIHYHRAGLFEEALSVFEETQKLADPVRDLEDLIFVDSELAELHIFRGSYDAAEDACRRGLERLEKRKLDDQFRFRMEVVLRASLGHLELRRLSLESARRELLAALRLSCRYGTTGERVAILNNLGITENQLNDFEKARGRFRQAERLLIRSGERRELIKISTNLAVIAAKLGDREKAYFHAERAAQMLRHFPGQRLEFFVTYSRGIVSHLFGDETVAGETLEQALRLGRKLGDDHLVSFGEVYLAEAHLACGRIGKALKTLRSLTRRAEKKGPSVLVRMAHSRLLLLETLLGRRRLAARSRRIFEETERSNLVLLETWNELFLGLALVGTAETASPHLDRAARVFRDLKVAAGERFARLALVVDAISNDEKDRLPELLQTIGDCRPAPHRLLDVAEPLTRAEAFFALSEIERADEWLTRASNAIVGLPFLELDWRIELLRARVAAKNKDPGDARRHLHRAVHTRDLLAQMVPVDLRKRFLGHRRFAALTDATARLERSPRVHHSTEQLRRTRHYEGMIGQSSSMLRIFHTIERLGDSDIPVVVVGETGTGKELVARAIHRRSVRNDAPFMAVHCPSLPAELFESEFFGHERGAFTGATRDRPGLLENLDGGTLLLDEVGQLPLASQTKLLQFLDSGVVRRLGSVTGRHVDLRVLASTSVNLEGSSRAGDFRADLYYRLRGMEISVPPLRQRRNDIAYLARHFLEQHASRLDRPTPALEPDAVSLLESYPWPGNVRELETAMFRVLINQSRAESLGATDIESILSPQQSWRFDTRLLESHDLKELKDDLEREYLTHLFLRVRGDPGKMMETLGVRRTQLYAWFRRLGIDVRALRRRH